MSDALKDKYEGFSGASALPYVSAALHASGGESQINELDFPGNVEHAFSQGKLTDKHFTLIVKCLPNAKLKRINLRHNLLGDGSVSALTPLLAGNACEVKEVILAGNEIGPEGCRELCSLLTKNNSVEKLDLSGNPIGNEGGREIAKLLMSSKVSPVVFIDILVFHFSLLYFLTSSLAFPLSLSVLNLSLSLALSHSCSFARHYRLLTHNFPFVHVP